MNLNYRVKMAEAGATPTGAGGAGEQAAVQAPAAQADGLAAQAPVAPTQAAAPSVQAQTQAQAPTAPPAAPTSDNPASVMAALRAESQALKAERDAWAAERHAEVATQRRAFIRGMGLAASLNDKDLDAILPSSDPRTDAGRQELVAWRESRAGLFDSPAAPPSLKAEDFAKTLGVEKSRIIGPTAIASALRVMHGGKA